MNKCPVCDKEFDDEELCEKHVNKHLNESVLNEPIQDTNEVFSSEEEYRTIDLKNIFPEAKFEKLCKLKMEELENDIEILSKRNFIGIIKKINRSNPFCYIPYFIKDYMSGTSQNDLDDKFHL